MMLPLLRRCATGTPRCLYRPPARLIHNFDTLAQHADSGVRLPIDEVAPAISVTTTFGPQDSGEYVYQRAEAPTRARAEAVLGALEGGHAVLYSSGLAAVYSALIHYQPERIFIDRGYHGTHQVIELLRRFRNSTLEVIPTLCDSPEELSREYALQKDDLLWIESPRNPDLKMFDIAGYSDVARAHHCTVVVDGTFTPPPIQHPLRLGAHCVMHSTTKYLAGHSDAVGGALITEDEHTAQELAEQRTVMGNTPGSLETWLLLRSLRTLRVRVEAQCKSAAKLATALLKHPEVKAVYHPSLPHHEQYALAQSQMKGGQCGIFSVELQSA